MSKYSSNYEWWIKEHPEMLTWVLDNEGNISIGDVIEALHNHPQCPLALKAVGVNTRIGKGGKKWKIGN